MDIDVVVPCIRALEEELSGTLRALTVAVGAAAPATVRVVVVDDRGPRDDVRDHAMSLGMTYAEGPGRGAGPARNAGAALGGAAVICFMDDDVLLDPTALGAVGRLVVDEQLDVVVGGLRPPVGAPAWLVETYERATLTPASGLAAERELAPHEFATGLAAVRREVWARTSGFPDVPGLEDALFGCELGAVVEGGVHLARRHALGGVHQYLPSWEEWLERSWASGRRLRGLGEQLPSAQLEVLVRARGLGGSLRAVAKRAAGALPASVLLGMDGSAAQRRLAAAGAEARGFAGRGWAP